MQSGRDTNDHGFVVMVLHMLMHNIDESELVGGIKKKVGNGHGMAARS